MPIGREPEPRAARAIWKALKTQHLRDLPEELQIMMVARACGFSYEQLGKRFGYSQRGARRTLDPVLDSIFVPLGLAREPWASGGWVCSHSECCLPFAAERLARGELFDPIPEPG